MAYTTSNLNSVEDCDTLILLVQNEIDSLDFKKTGLSYEQGIMSKTALEVDAELASAEAELAAVSQVYAGMLDGKPKDLQLLKKMRLELRVKVLENKEEKYGTIASILHESDLARVNLELVELNSLITSVENRKAEIQAEA